MEKLEVNQMSPLIWAYMGDAVYEQYIRRYLIINTKYKPHKLHIECIKFVKAGAQAHILQKLEGQLTEEENEIVRRTRNTENHHLPKNASVQEYMYSTAFEGLIGYLYLVEEKDRLKQILEMSLKIALEIDNLG